MEARRLTPRVRTAYDERMEPAHNSAVASRPAGLVVFDVDGVIFRGTLMLALAQRRGYQALATSTVDGLLYELGRLKLGDLLDRVYARLRGMPTGQVWDVYRAMPLAPGAREAVVTLRQRGYYVLLLTAGGPDCLIKDLAKRLDADEGAGIEPGVAGGRLTGIAGGELAAPMGKRLYVARTLERLGLTWRDTVVVGDDRNNLPLLHAARLGIGFNATHSVRREARVLVDDPDLRAILPHILRDEEQHRLLTRARSAWHHEIARKLIHMTCAAVPFLFLRWPGITTGLLIAAMAVYLFIEFWRVNGLELPGTRWLNRLVLRRSERSGTAFAPLTLALGALCAVWLFPAPVACAAVLTVALADSAAAVIGSRWGRRPWPHNPRKSLIGSAAFLAVALACGLLWLRLPQAALLAIAATLIESLPLDEWDNFLVPIGAGATVLLLST